MFSGLSHFRINLFTVRALLAGLSGLALLSACAPAAQPDITPVENLPQTSTGTPSFTATIIHANSDSLPTATASGTPLPAVIGPEYLPGFNPLPIQEKGPWAMFKLLKDRSTEFRASGGNKYLATFTLNSVSIRFLITAASTVNPFNKENPIRAFSCQG